MLDEEQGKANEICTSLIDKILLRNTNCVTYKGAHEFNPITGSFQLIEPLPFRFQDYARKDIAMYWEAQKARAQRTNILMGDYYIRNDGTLARVTMIYPNGHIQDSLVGSHHLFIGGNSNFSGGLDDTRTGPYILQDEKKEAEFWMFSQGRPMAHNAFYFDIPVRVWKEL